jgi:hypothetical protein
MNEPVYLYYELTNYHQNHRLYVKSRSADQLAGEDIDSEDISTECDPIEEIGDLDNIYQPRGMPKSKKANPCGLIAGSLFLDRFLLKPAKLPNSFFDFDLDVAWPEDDTDIYKADNSDDLTQWTDVEDDAFKVWMRVGATNNFRKLYAIIDEDLNEGKYTMVIVNRMDEDDFGGEKHFVLSTASKYGGKMDGFAYLLLITGIISSVWAVLIAVLKFCKFGASYHSLEEQVRMAKTKFKESMKIKR